MRAVAGQGLRFRKDPLTVVRPPLVVCVACSLAAWAKVRSSRPCGICISSREQHHDLERCFLALTTLT